MAPGWAGAGRHRGEGRPWGAGAQGQGLGFRQGGEAEGCPCVREPGAPIMCSDGRCHPRGCGAGRAQCQPRSHPSSLFPTWSQGPAAQLLPPAPALLLELGKALHPPSSMDRRETGEMCWKEALKKKKEKKKKEERWSQEQKKVPLWLVFLTMIKTSISASARATSGRETRGWPAGSEPHEHGRATLLLLPISLPAALNTRVGRGEGLGRRAGGGWISKMYKFISSIYNQ